MPEDELPPVEEREQIRQQQQELQQEQAAAEDERHDLLTRLRNQVAFYFSFQNLARDKYLRNMLTAGHPEMPSPRPAQLMCPMAVITNFPKVRDICAHFGEQEGQLPEPPAMLLARAMEGSNLVTISSDGNWIGPVSQQLPPPTMTGAPATTGGPPTLQYQQPHHFQQPAPHMNFQQGPFPQPQPMVPPGAPAMQYQPSGMPLPFPPPTHGVQYPNNVPLNAAPIVSVGGTDSPSSASMESMPSQQQQAPQQPQQGTNVNENAVVVVMNLPQAAVNPIQILTVFTTETIRPKSAFLDHRNTNLWFVSFGSEADAKAAILASAERTIAGMPVHAKLSSELPASSSASLSSASAPGQMVQQQQPPRVPLMGGAGYPLLPQGPSPQPSGMGAPPPPPGTAQTSMPLGYPPQYAMPPPQIQPPPQLAGMHPPGQPYPLHQQYYNPQQQMQQVYPGGFMQPQQQQGGPLQPQQQMMQPHPPPPRLANRFGVVPPPPPPQRSGYPGGPPPPYPYQGMHQQYIDGYGSQNYQHYCHPHPPLRQYSDQRQGVPLGTGAGGGGFHDHHQGHSRTGKKKKKNQQHNHRDSYGNSSNDNSTGFRRNSEYSNYGQQHQLRHDDSTSPIPGDQRGGHKSSWKHKRGDDQQFRRSHGNVSPSFHRSYNRHQHMHDRTSGSDMTPSTGSSSNRHAKKSEEKDIFSSSDFPGLGGLGGNDKPDKPPQQGSSKASNSGDGTNKQLVGYASVLLKKEAEEQNKVANTKALSAAETMGNHEVDSITRQTEEMERQILSEFHDLSLIGDGTNLNDDASSSSPMPANANNSQGPQHNISSAAADDKTEGTASSSTMDASASPSPSTHNLPILPAGPFLGNEGGEVGTVLQTAHSSELSPRQQQPQPPAVEDTNTQDFLRTESTNIADDGAVVPPPKEQTQPSETNNDPVIHVAENTKPPGVWGSKRFADVI